MSTFTKKIAVSLVTATTVVSLSGFGAFALPLANAATADELQAQIAQLLQMIASLQAQLNGTSGGTTTACSFTRSLTTGSDGADVMCLQQYLNGAGHSVSATGAGSPGNETTYFGSRTRAAVASWQAANGVAPAVGYFGPISQAKYTSLAGTSGGNTGGNLPPVVIPSGNLQVGLAANSATGSAISGAGQISVATFNLTAPATTGVTLTGFTMEKVGVLSDTSISNLYLANGSTGVVDAQFSSLNDGVAIFNNLNVNIPAGTTYQAEIRMDLASGVSAGNTIAWRLTGLTATGSTVTGLPVSANSLTVTSVSNPSISTVTLTANAVGSTVDAGSNSVQVSSWTANVSNSKVRLKALQFTFVGSANPSDIRNLRLLVNGTEVATLPQASSETVFAVPGGIELNTGNSTIQLFADVMGSPNRTFTFSLLQPYKAQVEDTQYNTGVSPTITSTNQTTITINTGSITVQVASDSPSNPAPVGASAVTLAKFSIYAAGEAVKVKFLDAKITADSGISNWGSASGVTDDLSNIRLIDDAGNQVGSTIATIAGGTTSGTCTLAAASIQCHFGASASPINYIVPANTTRVISLQADLASSSAFDPATLTGSLPTMTSNLEGLTSFTAASSGSATAATRTITSTPLTVAINTGFGVPTYIAGVQQARVASFVITASSAQGATISSLTFDKDSNTGLDLQNLKVMVNGTQFGSTKATVADAETSMAFSTGAPITIGSGQAVTVDVYSDILQTSTTTTNTAPIDIIGWSALGSISNSSITMSPTAVIGQNVTVSSGPTLTLAAASDTPPVRYVVMGSTDLDLFKIRLSSDNVDDVNVTTLVVTDTITNGSTGLASFQNYELWDGSTLVAGPVNATMPGSATSTITFNLSIPVTVLKNTSKTITVRADAATFTSGGATSNSVHDFGLAATSTATIVANAVGNSSATVTVSGTPSGENQTVYRTKLYLSSSLLGSATGRSRVSVDNIANLTFTADAGYQAIVGTVTLKFNGTAVSNGSTNFLVDIIDPNTGSNLGSASQKTCAPGAGNSCSVTFNPAYTIDMGGAKSVQVRVNSSSFYDSSTAGAAESMSVLVNAAGDVTFSDGSTSNVSLESTVVPFTVVNVSYN